MSSSDLSLSARSRTTFGVAGLAVLGVAAAAALVGISPSHPPSHVYTATFHRAGQGLDDRSLVKVRGLAVGSVQSVTLDQHGDAVVRFRVEKDVRVPSSASAGIEPLSVFGPKDLTLDLGTGEGVGPFLADGDPIARTVDPADLGDTGKPIYELTTAIDPDELYTVIHTLAQGIKGRGGKLRSINENAGKLLAVTYGNREAIEQSITDTAALSGTFAGHTDQLIRTVDALNELAPILVDNRDEFEKTLDNTIKIADGVSRKLKNNGDELGKLIDATSGLADTLYVERGNLPSLIGGLNGFFGGLVGILRIPGPRGTLMGAVNAFLSLNLCDTFNELCPKDLTPSQSGGGKKKGGRG
ncbi:hypothetical protein GCM10027589_27240 [Actinocorallia lasiicapitis]